MQYQPRQFFEGQNLDQHFQVDVSSSHASGLPAPVSEDSHDQHLYLHDPHATAHRSVAHAHNVQDCKPVNMHASYHIVVAVHMPHTEIEKLNTLDNIADSIETWKRDIEDARVADYEKDYANIARRLDSHSCSQDSSSITDDSFASQVETHNLTLHDKVRAVLKKKLRRTCPIQVHIVGDWNIDMLALAHQAEDPCEQADCVAPAAAASHNVAGDSDMGAQERAGLLSWFAASSFCPSLWIATLNFQQARSRNGRDGSLRPRVARSLTL